VGRRMEGVGWGGKGGGRDGREEGRDGREGGEGPMVELAPPELSFCLRPCSQVRNFPLTRSIDCMQSEVKTVLSQSLIN
jgi:hypothetical protein